MLMCDSIGRLIVSEERWRRVWWLLIKWEVFGWGDLDGVGSSSWCFEVVEEVGRGFLWVDKGGAISGGVRDLDGDGDFGGGRI